MIAARRRPVGITAISVLSAVAALIVVTSGASLLWPGGPLGIIWRAKPDARDAFVGMGRAAPLLLAIVAAACLAAALGLWRGRRWGHRLAVFGLAANLIGDLANSILRRDLRAAVGAPIVAALITYLLRRPVRAFFEKMP